MTTITDAIIKNAQEIREDEKNRNTTKFYDYVYLGTHNEVARVIAKLKETDVDLLEWLLCSPDDNFKKTNKLCMWFMLIPCWIIFTPIFYFLHMVIYKFLNTKFVWHRLSLSKKKNIDLPLAWAALSGNSKMVKLFLDQRYVKLKDTDEAGNNIFHYIADLSRDYVNDAQLCYENLIICIQHKDAEVKQDLRRLIGAEKQFCKSSNLQTNKDKICELLKINSKIKSSTPDDELCEYIHDELRKDTSAEIREMLKEGNKHLVDVLEYASHFGGMQLASRMIEDTLIETFNPDTDDFEFNTLPSNEPSKCSQNKHDSEESNCDINIQRKWLKMDITWDTLPCRNGFLSQLLNFIVSRELTSQSEEGIICIQTNACVQKWINTKIKQWTIPVYLFGVMDILITVYIFLMIGTVFELDLNWTPNKNLFTKYHVEVFLTRWNQTEYTNTVGNNFFSRYTDIHALFSNKDKFIDYVELMELITKLDGYENFSKMNMTQLYSDICVTGTQYLQVGDMTKLDNCSLIASENLASHCADSTSRYGYLFNDQTMDTYEFAITSSFMHNIFINKRSSLRTVIISEYLSPNSLVLLGSFLYSYFLMRILLDVLIRVWTVFSIIKSKGTWYSIFGASPLPGCYWKSQLDIYAYCGASFYIWYHWNDINAFLKPPEKETDLMEDIISYDRTTVDNLQTNLPMCIFAVTIIVSRFLLHLHFMKVFPWLGSFVITLFQMTIDLMAFILIYLVVDIFFGSMFFAFTRLTDCPVKSADNLQTVPETLFASFAFVFGHVDLELLAFPMQVTYVFYVLTTVFILLNLIIAVISAKATYVTVEPWVSQLHQNANAREALGVEHWIAPFTKVDCLSKLYVKMLKCYYRDDEKEQKDDSNMVIFDVENSCQHDKKKEKKGGIHIYVLAGVADATCMNADTTITRKQCWTPAQQVRPRTGRRK